MECAGLAMAAMKKFPALSRRCKRAELADQKSKVCLLSSPAVSDPLT
jgi:hypothetical protein